MRVPAAIAVSLLAAGCAGRAAVTPSAAAPAAASATAATGARGTFVLLHGADTVGVERFTRGPDRLQAEFSARGQVAFRYDAALAADATVSRLEVTAVSTGAGTSSATFRGDSVVLAQGSGDSLRTSVRAAPRGSVPYLNPSPSLMEQILRRAHVLGGRTVSVPLFVAGAGSESVVATVTFTAPDSARLELAGTTLAFSVEPSGGILSASVAAQGLTIVRVAAP